MYGACRIIAKHVRWTGDLTWSFMDCQDVAGGEVCAHRPRPARRLTQITQKHRRPQEFDVPVPNVDKTRVGHWRTDRRFVPFVTPLADDMRELGYEI